MRAQPRHANIRSANVHTQFVDDPGFTLPRHRLDVQFDRYCQPEKGAALSISCPKYLHDGARLVCEEHADQLTDDEYDALALVAIAFDAGAPITQQQHDAALALIERFMK